MTQPTMNLRTGSNPKKRNTGKAWSKSKRRGATIVLFAIFLVVVILCVAVAVEFGAASLSRGQLHTSSDAAALAGVSRIYRGPTAVRSETRKYVNSHTAYGTDHPELRDEEIVIGEWDAEANPPTFTPRSDDKGNAVRVTNRTTDRQLFFGKVLGAKTFSAQSTSIAALIPREIVFVVDCSGSMNDDTEPAWATQAIDAKASGVGTNAANTLREQLQLPFAELDLKTQIEGQVYLNDIQCLPGIPLGTPVNFSVISPEYSYAVMTMNNGVLSQSTIPSAYRISTGDSEATRRRKCYKFIRETVLRDGGLVPQFPPFDSDENSKSTRYWNRYIDYVMNPVTHNFDPPRSPPAMPSQPSPPGSNTGRCCIPPPPPHHQPPPPHHQPHHQPAAPHTHGNPHAHHQGHHDNHHQLPHHHHHHHHSAHVAHGPHGHTHSSHVPAHHTSPPSPPPHAGPNGAIQPRQEWFKEWQRGNLPTLASRAGTPVEVASLEAAVECIVGRGMATQVGGLHPIHFPNFKNEVPGNPNVTPVKSPYNPPSAPHCPSPNTLNSSCVSEEIAGYNAAYAAYSAAWDNWYNNEYPQWHVAYQDYFRNYLPPYLATAKKYGSPPYNRGNLPPSPLTNYFSPATVDKIADLGVTKTFSFNNPNNDLHASDKTVPRQFLNKFGWRTYMQFCLDYGRDEQPAMDSLGKNGVYNVPLSLASGVCPEHSESVGDTDNPGDGVPTFSGNFPPNEQPMHALRRSMIVAMMVLKKYNEQLDEKYKDRVAVIQYDRYVTIPGYEAAPVLLSGLTTNYDSVASSATRLQSVSDRGRSTAIEAGMITAFNHLNATARRNSHKVVIVITDGVPNEIQSTPSTIDAWAATMNASGHSADIYNSDSVWSAASFPPGDKRWRNGALMQTNLMRNMPGSWDIYPVGVGMGVNSDFLNKMSRLGGTDKLIQQQNLTVANPDPSEIEKGLIRAFKAILDQPRVYLVQ